MPEYAWDIRFRKSGKTTIRAAYVQHGTSSAERAVAAVATPDTPVVLKDAAHQIVFLAPSSVILSVTRRGRHPAGSAHADPGPIVLGKVK
jgi:hypothetical protein